MSPVDFGSRTAVLRHGRFSVRFRMRTALMCAALALATVTVAILALCLGDLPLSPVDVVAALLGSQEGIGHLVVFEWRLPRVLSAVVFGAALGVSGAIFQSLTRNPLASPDVIGLSAGSYAGGLVMIIVFGVGAGSVPVAGGAIIGGLLAAAAVYLLAYRNGMHGFLLIVVGIGVSAMLEALGVYLILRAKLEVAMVASVWGMGSLNPVGWAQFVPAFAVVAIVFLGLGFLVRPMRQLELGDDAARSLGSRVEPARLWLVVCAVALTAVVTGAAGPIAFISLAAPQIAQRLTRTAGIALAPSALIGALVLTASDVVAQYALPDNLPVGLVTVVVGGGYLVWLLIHEVRRRR
ncbi:iron complex transport system permease protein [Agreia bicolorata]|uniref:Iron complex transport system permease protein n=1 Tax=Agreia bicolorata TaxID=110935 RepID=A0A1T4YEF7_9MICO|nr:iron chelate uptake ABC transporter family permease subunit [Agreia bicolorata]SKB00166.1 iron complex transport system permease protein [Agreia bicolorata]